jgi:hypothetical protein
MSFIILFVFPSKGSHQTICSQQRYILSMTFEIAYKG